MFCASGMTRTEIYQKICSQRGINNPDEFFNPGEEWIIDPFAMTNMEAAVRLMRARINSEIGILFDVDADGLTSGTELYNGIMELKQHENATGGIQTFINTGKKHGLLTGDNLDKILNSGIKLLLIPDSLDGSDEAYNKCKMAGINIIILDHHDIPTDAEYSAVLVSSQANYDNPALSGAGVVLKFLMAIDEEFGTNIAENNYDLAAIGILADVSNVYESMENRAIISKGLENLQHPGIKKILGQYEFNSKSILYSIAPVVNACVRTNQNKLVKDFFLETENKNILALKKKLEEQREIQKEEVARLEENVMEQLDKCSDLNIAYAIIKTDLGISGLLGNTMLEKYNKPIFIFNDFGNDNLTGSCRAIGYQNFKDECNATGLIDGKGHQDSFGLFIKRNNIERFIDKINKKLSKLTFECVTSDYDFEIPYYEVDSKLAYMLMNMNKITGEQFKPITVKITGITDYTPTSFKNGQHLVLKVDNTNIQIIEWNTAAEVEFIEEDVTRTVKGEKVTKKEQVAHFPEWEEHSMMNDSIDVIAEIESGFFGKELTVKLISKKIIINS